MSKRKNEEFSTKRVTKVFVLTLVILATTILGFAGIWFVVSKLGQPIMQALQEYWSGMIAGFIITTVFMITVIARVQAKSEREPAKKEPKKVEFTPDEVLRRCGVILCGIVITSIVIGGSSFVIAKHGTTVAAWLLKQWVAIIITVIAVVSAFVLIMYNAYNNMMAKKEEEKKKGANKALRIIVNKCHPKENNQQQEDVLNMDEAEEA